MKKVTAFLLGEKGLRVLETLTRRRQEISIVVVIGQDPEVLNDYSSDIETVCRSKGLEFCYRREYESFRVDKHSPHLHIAIGWRWLIRGIPTAELVVFHDSLLPRYRGFAPLVNALLNFEREIGVTALYATEQYDRGPIIAQQSLQVTYPTTIQKEIHRISHCYADLADEVIELYSAGALPEGRVQIEASATYSLWRDEVDYFIDWNWDASYIENFINCVGYPYSGAKSKLNGKHITVQEGLVVGDVTIENRTPGKVIFLDDVGPTVVCGTGLIKITKMTDGENAQIELSKFRSRFS
ncbi:MAG: formyltransferase family protein [Pseudomonadota bacterium]